MPCAHLVQAQHLLPRGIAEADVLKLHLHSIARRSAYMYTIDEGSFEMFQ